MSSIMLNIIQLPAHFLLLLLKKKKEEEHEQMLGTRGKYPHFLCHANTYTFTATDWVWAACGLSLCTFPPELNKWVDGWLVGSVGVGVPRKGKSDDTSSFLPHRDPNEHRKCDAKRSMHMVK